MFSFTIGSFCFLEDVSHKLCNIANCVIYYIIHNKMSLHTPCSLSWNNSLTHHGFNIRSLYKIMISMTFSPHLCLDFCTILLTSEPWETDLKFSSWELIASGNEIFLFNAYILHVCSLFLISCLMHLPVSHPSELCIRRGDLAAARRRALKGSSLDESAVCLFVFGWKWCHYACSPPLSVTLTKLGPLRRSRWHDRCASAVTEDSARCGSRISSDSACKLLFLWAHVSYSPLNKVRM